MRFFPGNGHLLMHGEIGDRASSPNSDGRIKPISGHISSPSFLQAHVILSPRRNIPTTLVAGRLHECDPSPSASRFLNTRSATMGLAPIRPLSVSPSWPLSTHILICVRGTSPRTHRDVTAGNPSSWDGQSFPCVILPNLASGDGRNPIDGMTYGLLQAIIAALDASYVLGSSARSDQTYCTRFSEAAWACRSASRGDRPRSGNEGLPSLPAASC